MKLKSIIAEIAGEQQVKNDLLRKQDDLEVKKKELKDRIAKQTEKIRKKKEVEKWRRQHKSTASRSSVQENKSNVSQRLRLSNGATIGFTHQTEGQTRFFDASMKLVAIETRQGTFNGNGKKISSDAIGLFALGILWKK